MITLNPDEKLIKVVRKHWLVFVLDHFYLVILAIAPLVFSGMFLAIISGLPAVSQLWDLKLLGVFIYFLWLLGLWSALAISLTNYYLDVWYVTDERLVDVDQKGLFLRNEATVRFSQIQDMTIETSGILGTFFGFGTIMVQTAGESPEFQMKNVVNPEQLKEQMLLLVRNFEDRPQKVVL
jgi:uncharacterized membrane protein YdbT with pleckstrin-like domain